MASYIESVNSNEKDDLQVEKRKIFDFKKLGLTIFCVRISGKANPKPEFTNWKKYLKKQQIKIKIHIKHQTT